MNSRVIERTAGWHAFKQFFAGVEETPEGFDFDAVLENVREGDIPEGWMIWEVFEGKTWEDVSEWVEAAKDSYADFLTEISQLSTYFAEDGNYGSASNIAVVDTSAWNDDEWAEVDEASDYDRAETALAIDRRHAEK